MKVIGFVGSPRKNGNTSSLVNQVLKGASEQGADTKVYSLEDMNIKGCKGCLYCRKNEVCAINDDMQQILADVKNADALVIGTPIYICQVSGQMKLMLDRFYPLTTNKHQPRFGEKIVITVYSHAAPLPVFFKKYMDYTEKHLKPMGLNVVDRIISTMAINTDSSLKNKTLMNKAYNTGNLLAAGKLSMNKKSFLKRLLK